MQVSYFEMIWYVLCRSNSPPTFTDAFMDAREVRKLKVEGEAKKRVDELENLINLSRLIVSTPRPFDGEWIIYNMYEVVVFKILGLYEDKNLQQFFAVHGCLLNSCDDRQKVFFLYPESCMGSVLTQTVFSKDDSSKCKWALM